jgi:hypothetical protein
MFPKPTYKTGGTNTRKPSKNDRAMVSGVSSILRKIKDKKNRKEVAGDMVKQFNREGVNYNKEKFLKNSRSFAVGGPVKPYYTSNPNDPRIKSYQDSLSLYNRGLNAINPLLKNKFKVDNNEWNNFRNKIKDKKTGEKMNVGPFKGGRYTILNKEKAYSPISNIKPTNYIQLTRKSEDRPIFGDEFGSMFKSGDDFWYAPQWDKPKQPVIYKPAPKKSTMTTMSKTPNKKATTTSTTSTTPKTTTSTVTPTVTTSTTSTVQTPKQLPANTPQMQRYNNMSTDDKKRAVKKYGDPSKVPFQGVDISQLRREVPTFKKGGQHGGLDRWFAEKWVDVKSGKPCGRQEGENRAYPACRPSKRISSKTPKTSSELSSQEKARFKATKTSSQRIPYNHKRK